MDFTMISVLRRKYQSTLYCIANCRSDPLITFPLENRIEGAVKQLAGLLRVFLGVRGRGRQPSRGLVQNGDNSLLFGGRRNRYLATLYIFLRDALMPDSAAHPLLAFGTKAVLQKK